MISQYNSKFLILFSLLLCAYYPILPDLINIWMEDSNNSHGLLVPIISGYIIYENKESMKLYLSGMDGLECNFWTSTFGLFIFVGSLLIYVLFFVGNIAVIPRLMLVVSLISLIWYYFGIKLVKILLFPLVFLFFMVPVPVSLVNDITLPMKTFATNMAAPLIRLFDIPVFQEGNIIHLSTCTLEVAEACSGIRSIVSMIMLSTLFAYMMKNNNYKRLILVLFSPVIAIVANILRVSGTGILAHHYGEKVARGYVHEFSGFLVFGFGLTVLFLLFSILNKSIKPNVSK